MDTETMIGATVTVEGYSGVAWRIVGWEQVWEPITYLATDDDGNEWEEDSGEGEWIDSPDCSRIVAIMVGDDRKFTFDVSDVSAITSDDYCADCGQVGCGWNTTRDDSDGL